MYMYIVNTEGLVQNSYNSFAPSPQIKPVVDCINTGYFIQWIRDNQWLLNFI